MSIHVASWKIHVFLGTLSSKAFTPSLPLLFPREQITRKESKTLRELANNCVQLVEKSDGNQHSISYRFLRSNHALLLRNKMQMT